MPLPYFPNTASPNINNKINNQTILCEKVLELLGMDSTTLDEKDAWIQVYRELKLRILID